MSDDDFDAMFELVRSMGGYYIGPRDWMLAVTADDRAIDRPGNLPHDDGHNRAFDVVKDIVNGRITKPGRDMLRDALDRAPADPKVFPRL